MEFNGQKVLITGGSSGIGLATARALAAQGANIWILAREPQKLEAACDLIAAARLNQNQQVETLAADVTSAEQVKATVEQFVQQNGAPHLLINSAGIAQPGKIAEQDLSIFRSMMEVNYFGTLNAINAVLPGMIQRGSGHIVNISSVAGFLSVYGYGAYGASKFAIRALSDSLRYELAEHGIQVSVVFPPDTKTPQLDFEAPLRPPLTAELEKSNSVLTADAVAESILKGVARGKYIITPGFDSWLYFQLTNFFGLVYPIMDFMVAQARRSMRNRNGNGAAKHHD